MVLIQDPDRLIEADFWVLQVLEGESFEGH